MSVALSDTGHKGETRKMLVSALIRKEETADIILPSKIGDCVMAFPALVCLRQLIDRSRGRKFKVRLFSSSKLKEVLKLLPGFEICEFGLKAKIKSLFFPSDNALFLHATTKNHGFNAKKTYGMPVKAKNLRYHNDMTYLSVNETRNLLPEELFEYLKTKYGFSTLTIGFFGICLELGFTAEDIMKHFVFDKETISFGDNLSASSEIPEGKKYFVFCMEAANGGKKDADRRWDEAYYLEIAERIYKEHNIEAVFIGTDDSMKLPDVAWVKDFRKKMSLYGLCGLFKNSMGYIGNDTGPLHLANLMKKPSVGIYFRWASLTDYTPVFKELNRPLFCPESTDRVLQEVNKIL